MRIVSFLAALLVLFAGILFGALNPASARIDLYFASFELALGPALLLAALLGALLGGLAVALGVAVPLRRRLSRARSAVAADPPNPLIEPGNGAGQHE